MTTMKLVEKHDFKKGSAQIFFKTIWRFVRLCLVESVTLLLRYTFNKSSMIVPKGISCRGV